MIYAVCVTVLLLIGFVAYLLYHLIGPDDDGSGYGF